MAGAGLRLCLGMGEPRLTLVYTPLIFILHFLLPPLGIPCTLLPFHLTGGPPTLELEVSLEIAQTLHFTAQREAQGGEGAWPHSRSASLYRAGTRG